MMQNNPTIFVRQTVGYSIKNKNDYGRISSDRVHSSQCNSSAHSTMVQSSLLKNIVFSAHMHMHNAAYISSSCVVSLKHTTRCTILLTRFSNKRNQYNLIVQLQAQSSSFCFVWLLEYNYITTQCSQLRSITIQYNSTMTKIPSRV